MSNINFTCPYCSKPTTATSPHVYDNIIEITLENNSEIGEVSTNILAISCPNPECQKLFFKVSLLNNKRWIHPIQKYRYDTIKDWQLLPESQAIVLPDYLPKAIQEDYYEACRIRDLSPKASSTLSRRCLQGMIRDFHGIRKPKLADAIIDLEEKVEPLVWEAIDSVRSVGNIGAHMEQDINVIIDVDPEEAQLLIELIEQLIEDWYVRRFEKNKKLGKIKQLSENKREEKKKK
jgi:hypothetical protein